MKNLMFIALVLMLVIAGCHGCSKTVHIFHDRNNPDDSMGIVIIPIPVPEPSPMPKPNPYPMPLESDPWCNLYGIRRV
jgi:hypothetical protein